MEKRSDSDVLLKELKLTFGEKEYVVPVLRMAAAAKWRKEFYERTREVSETLPEDFDGTPGELSKAIGQGLMGAILKFPEKIPELVFSYAPSLEDKKEEIMLAAYDQEFQRAFGQIWQVAFGPFLASLGTVLEMQRSSASPSRSSAGLN